MKILALEFSSHQRSAAVVESVGPWPATTRDNPPAHALSEAVETGGRTTHALGLIEEALREARLEREQVECLAIGLGPGSYTGVRAAIAVAQGWQLAVGARGIKLLGISTAECLAALAQEEGIVGRVAVAIDAQRDEFYLADYELDANGRRVLTPLRVATLAEVQAREAAGEIIIGPEATSCSPRGRVLFPRAATLGRLAIGRSDFLSGEKLEPIYLRETRFVKAPPSRVEPR